MATDRLRAFLLPLALCTLLVGCGKVKARMEFKQGNASYKTENYRDAIKYYKKGLKLDPGATQVWRSVGLAAMAVYRPGDASKQNLQYAEEALEAFEKFAQAYPNDAKVQDYILTILMSSDRFDDALKRLRARSATNPNDKENNQAIITVLIRAGKLDEAIAYVKSLGTRADSISHYTVGVALWDKAYHDPMLTPEERMPIVDAGVEELRKSVAMTPDSFDSLVYLNLILREKAKLLAEPDPEGAQALIAEATIYQDKAKAIVAKRKATEAAAS